MLNLLAQLLQAQTHVTIFVNIGISARIESLVKIAAIKDIRRMVVFANKTQFIVFPTIGFVIDAGSLCITAAFLWFGVAFRIIDFKEND